MPVRKRVDAMIGQEQRLFRRVLRELIADPLTGPNATNAFGNLVRIHADSTHRQHGQPFNGRFLPWHRALLLEMERLMQGKDPASFIPYWAWTTQECIPNMVVGFLPSISINSVTLAVTRTVAIEDDASLPPAALITDLIRHQNGQTDTAQYLIFCRRAERLLYDAARKWVGGTMTTADAAADPFYWILLATIDKIWADWQAFNPATNQINLVSGTSAMLDPFEDPTTGSPRTANSVLSIDSLGYSYQSEAPVNPVAPSPG
ncbi:MAG: tyrosinase family protein [Thermomicrobiales bacterium]